MVDYNVRIYDEDDGKIIGAEVTFFSDSGNKIAYIDIADATTLEEMQEALEVIDETYFTEDRLKTILANLSENTPINATKLSGFMSSDFAKVSQLSNYAQLSHSHSISQITNLYDYQIYASSYNVGINNNVTITVKVTNRATGQPVVGATVPVLKNNSSWQSGTTGVNGTFSLTYTADTWGLTTFSAQNVSTQIMVTGWKYYMNDSNYTIRYNQDTVEASIHINTGVSWTNSWTAHGAEIIPASLRPLTHVVSIPYSYSKGQLMVRSDSNYLYRYSDTTATHTVYGFLTWHY